MKPYAVPVSSTKPDETIDQSGALNTTKRSNPYSGALSLFCTCTATVPAGTLLEALLHAARMIGSVTWSLMGGWYCPDEEPVNVERMGWCSTSRTCVRSSPRWIARCES